MKLLSKVFKLQGKINKFLNIEDITAYIILKPAQTINDLIIIIYDEIILLCI